MSDEDPRFGPYRVVQTLAQGAVTTLFTAVQEPLGRVVVVKALKAQISPTSSFGEHIEREARILADLAHPNVVLVVEHGRGEGGRPFLALEHVDGPSLEGLLAKRKKLPLDAALAIALGVCDALAHVHERGVVHRDVKPGNVLLAKSGVVKLIDFGIAQRTRGQPAKDAFGTESVTPSGRIAAEPLGDGFGTPAYMSPEQILGDFVDGRSDLFSLGVVLYQMLAGVRPWDGAASRGRTSGPPLRREPPIALRDRAPDVPRTVERLVMRLLEAAPSARHPTAAMLRERLEVALRTATREPPASLLRAVLADAGFVPKLRARSASTDARAELEGPGAWPLPRVFAGLGAVLVAFVGVAFLVDRPARVSAQRGGARLAVLAPGSGLRVLATPWAHVRVDGVDVETTPFARPIPLTPGKHWVQLAHPELATFEREVEIGEDQVVTLDVTMSAQADAGAGAEREAR